jgi:predicted secreted protein
MFRPFLLATALFALPAYALDQLNQVDFSAEVTREVGNDLMAAHLSADISDRQAAQVSAQLNGVLNAALHRAEDFPSIHLSSGSQTTFPIYGKNNQPTGWRGHGELLLETHDFKSASDLIARIQDSVQLSSVTFSISPDAYRRIQNEMIVEGMAEFRKRAKVIVDAMNGRGYRIVHLNIEQGYATPAPLMARMADSAPVAPDFSPGVTPLTLRISGTIEVQEH